MTEMDSTMLNVFVAQGKTFVIRENGDLDQGHTTHIDNTNDLAFRLKISRKGAMPQRQNKAAKRFYLIPLRNGSSRQ